LLAIAAGGSGCATGTPRPDAEPKGGAGTTEVSKSVGADSSIDITYVLGHSHRRFVAWSKNDACGGQTLVDHQILRESGIDRGHYTEYFNKVEQFVSTPHRKPAEQGAPLPADDACRTPFTVTLRLGSETKIVQGCRGADDGALSHLVRDGEFLLYAQ
jgi:hypothetical protein